MTRKEALGDQHYDITRATGYSGWRKGLRHKGKYATPGRRVLTEAKPVPDARVEIGLGCVEVIEVEEDSPLPIVTPTISVPKPPSAFERWSKRLRAARQQIAG